MKSRSYTHARRTNKYLKHNNAAIFESQRKSGHNQGHSKVWKKKNVLLDMNEVNLCKKNGFHLEG